MDIHFLNSTGTTDFNPSISVFQVRDVQRVVSQPAVGDSLDWEMLCSDRFLNYAKR
ncbi:hypothetical protein [Pseudanabaena sp. ABRG5-3]|uniref:hypothetical protein n=1 Tax=Pseudanabaena sp. ABRG5-3 TaxID=685565 RepID=UPI0013A619D7|nr:hypothetical protein [Pseudanabaena sp. ABRG5-3]